MLFLAIAMIAIFFIGMALSADAEVDRKDGELISIPCAVSHIYKGSFLGASSGYARALTAGDVFLGISYEEKDNSAGSAGDLSVRAWRRGVFLLTGSGFTQGTVGSVIYASDDATVTTTAGSNSKIGRCVGYYSATQIWVDIDPVAISV